MINLQIIEIIGEFIRSITLVCFFNRVMTPKNKKYSKIFSIIMVIFYYLMSSITMNNMAYSMHDKKLFLFIFSGYISVLIYPLLFRKGRLSEKFFWSSFYMSMVLVSSFIVYITFSELLNTTLSEILIQLNYKRGISMLVNRFVQFLLLYIFLNNRKNINLIKYIKDNTLYVGGIILILNQILIFIIEMDLIKGKYIINLKTLIVVFMLSVVHVLSIYILNTLSKEIEEKFILKMNLDRKIHDKEIINMYTDMIGWKHDFRNHINMILGMLEVSTKEEVISYINEINGNIRELDKNMYTDNIAINSILITKMKVIDEKNIKINLDLKIDSKIKISNVDICIILGNLLDNAIEACSIINGYKFIDLKIVSKNDKLIIKIINNTNGYVNEVNGKFLSTKNNYTNGIGLIQIDNIIKKYSGYINRKHENNIFTTHMML